MKILIIQTAFIGDVILATPVFLEVKRCLRDAELHVLVRKGNEGLLKNFPGIDRILTWDKRQRKLPNLYRLVKEIRNEQYDIVINIQRFAASGILTVLSAAKETTGFRKNPFSPFFSRKIEHDIGGENPMHETARNLLLIRHLGARDSRRPALFPDTEDFKTTSQFKNTPYRCIAPASVWATKQVPAEKWVELIRDLLLRNPADILYLLGGPSDVDLCKQIQIQSGHPGVVSLAGKLSFLQTAALMKDARMNFVNDSAPLHIASAMNAPVTVFFCSTTPAFGFGPLSDNHQIVEVQSLSCKPCGLHGHRECPKKHFRCGYELNMQRAATNA